MFCLKSNAYAMNKRTRSAGFCIPKCNRAGAATVEFAIVAPIMIMFMLGMVEVGGLMLIKNGAIHASREGARLAITPTATSIAVQQRVVEQMQQYSAAGVSVVITPAVLSTAEPGDMVTVRVEVDASAIGWITGAVQLPISTIAGETTMRRETTN